MRNVKIVFTNESKTEQWLATALGMLAIIPLVGDYAFTVAGLQLPGVQEFNPFLSRVLIPSTSISFGVLLAKLIGLLLLPVAWQRRSAFLLIGINVWGWGIVLWNIQVLKKAYAILLSQQ